MYFGFGAASFTLVAPAAQTLSICNATIVSVSKWTFFGADRAAERTVGALPFTDFSYDDAMLPEYAPPSV